MGKLINLNPPAAITDADLPASIARDLEIAAGLAAHLAALDPHSHYLNSLRGDERYRLKTTPLTDIDIPSGIARDAEYIAADAAHVNAQDPHSQYFNFLRGDARYEYRAIRASKSINGPISFSQTSWNSLGTIPGFSLGTQGEPSAILVGLCFLFDIRYPWQQAVCAGLLGAVWWQPITTADVGIRVPLENHNQSGFFLNIRISQGIGTPNSSQGSGENRYIEIKPEGTLNIPSGGRVDLILKKLL